MLKIFLLTILCCCSLLHAKQPYMEEPRTYETCFEEAAEAYGLPLEWLLALSFTESSFWPDSSNNNNNGTSDFGFMQINTIWQEEAESVGYDWEKIMNDPCTNIMFGSYILRHNYERKNSFKYAIGSYNAGLGRSKRAQANRLRYYGKVKKNIEIAENNLHRLQIPLDPHYYQKLEALKAAAPPAWQSHTSPFVRLNNFDQLRTAGHAHLDTVKQLVKRPTNGMKVWLARWYVLSIIDNFDS